MSADDRRQQGALLALAGLPRVGPARLNALLTGSTPTEAVERILAGRCQLAGVAADQIATWRVRLREVDGQALIRACEAESVRLTMPSDDDWPSRFDNDPEPPAVLFSKGTLPVLSGPTVGVVGTRRCTRYGRDIAYELGRVLAGAAVAVVSGLALGIDAAAHAGVLAGQGVPVGVVAGGLDVVYPPANRGLWQACASDGLLLSEVPLGTSTGRWGFPARNRIIAALSDIVVVVESGPTGGSMYTVDEALRRDRPVFAVPGPIRSSASLGTNRLLADGALPMCEPLDVVEALGLAQPAPTPKPVTSRRARDAEEALIEHIGWERMNLDDLVGRTGRDAAAVALDVERLISAGLLVRSGPWIERAAAAS